jgi:hypothetical protein
MSSGDALKGFLETARHSLNNAVREIKQIPLEPVRECIQHVALAHEQIAQLEFKLYRLRPDFIPESLWAYQPTEGLISNQQIVEGALARIESLRLSGQAQAALDLARYLHRVQQAGPYAARIQKVIEGLSVAISLDSNLKGRT